jgi:hypothetical protein
MRVMAIFKNSSFIALIAICQRYGARGTCTARIYDYHQAIGPAAIKKEARKD